MIRLRIYIPGGKAPRERYLEWSPNTPTRIGIFPHGTNPTNSRDLETALKIIKAAREVTKPTKKEATK